MSHAKQNRRQSAAVEWLPGTPLASYDALSDEGLRKGIVEGAVKPKPRFSFEEGDEVRVSQAPIPAMPEELRALLEGIDVCFSPVLSLREAAAHGAVAVDGEGELRVSGTVL
mgnify:CR=1 FL=1